MVGESLSAPVSWWGVLVSLCVMVVGAPTSLPNLLRHGVESEPAFVSWWGVRTSLCVMLGSLYQPLCYGGESEPAFVL